NLPVPLEAPTPERSVGHLLRSDRELLEELLTLARDTRRTPVEPSLRGRAKVRLNEQDTRVLIAGRLDVPVSEVRLTEEAPRSYLVVVPPGVDKDTISDIARIVLDNLGAGSVRVEP